VRSQPIVTGTGAFAARTGREPLTVTTGIPAVRHIP
jgi:hypothetical protein